MNIIHERRVQRANDVLRRSFKITGLTKFLGGLLILTALITSVQAASVTLAWNRSTNAIVAGYKIHDGVATHTYTNIVNAGNATNTIISGLIPGTTYYFVATTYTASGVESLFSGELSYSVPLSIPIVNQPPTLSALGGLTINSNAGPQTVNLTGITSGASNEVQTLTVTATSSNTNLIRTPTVSYTSANTNGTFSFAPVTNKNGTATITVTVNDGGASNNLTSRSFIVTVGLAPPPPSVQVRVTPARQFILTVTGQVGHTYNIEATQDFKTWTVISTATVGATGLLNFTDTNAARFSRRFYRTRG